METFMMISFISLGIGLVFYSLTFAPCDTWADFIDNIWHRRNIKGKIMTSTLLLMSYAFIIVCLLAYFIPYIILKIWYIGYK